MATNSQTPLLVLSSENVEQGAKLAWSQVSSVAENVSEPTVGRATGFLPSELCYKAMNIALEEYLQKVETALSTIHIILSNILLGIVFQSTPKDFKKQKGRRCLFSRSA
jgi:hypothetical protein